MGKEILLLLLAFIMIFSLTIPMNVLGMDNDSNIMLGSNKAGVVMASTVQDRPNKSIKHEANFDYKMIGGCI